MYHHVRSGIAIACSLAYLGISLLLEHRPTDWEYVFLMFVIFSSAMQDAMDNVNHRLEELTRLVNESSEEMRDVSREIRQEIEYLKAHVTAEADLVTYKIELRDALQAGRDIPEPPTYPEPKFVPIEPGKTEQFDAEKWRVKKIYGVERALRDFAWWDMSVLTSPVRRLVANIIGRPRVIRWLGGE